MDAGLLRVMAVMARRRLPAEVSMDITALNGTTNVPVAAAPAAPPQKAAENRSIVQAVKALNGTEMFGHDNQLTFQRDPHSQRMVIRVIDKRTQEVVAQIPQEYVLRLAEDLKPAQVNPPPARTG
ncbi:MAG TPA: flagellar protein FlaG [Bryobacteraceae bacterium]|jgi:uncharacterized FlaG/YvyC family protein|nr:flagellar protein FlaG [Bryobacteraceae bacterium]